MRNKPRVAPAQHHATRKGTLETGNTGQHARVIALTAGLAVLLGQDGPWAEALTRHTTALHSARHLGDRSGQAWRPR